MENMSSEILMELAEIRRTLQNIAISLERQCNISTQKYNVEDLAKTLEYYFEKRKGDQNENRNPE